MEDHAVVRRHSFLDLIGHAALVGHAPFAHGLVVVLVPAEWVFKGIARVHDDHERTSTWLADDRAQAQHVRFLLIASREALQLQSDGVELQVRRQWVERCQCEGVGR